MTSTQISLVSAIFAGLSALLALIAIIVAVHAQRQNYRQVQRRDEQVGSLKSVHMNYRGWKRVLTINFEALNGPADVTVTAAELEVCYFAQAGNGRSASSFSFTVDSAEFPLMGLRGPTPGFRLLQNDMVRWQLQTGVIWGLSEGQEVQLRFSVTASGKTISSDPWTCGSARHPGVFSPSVTGKLEGNIETVKFLIRHADDMNYPSGFYDWLSYAVAEEESASKVDDVES
jgi:hypothetical protein